MYHRNMNRLPHWDMSPIYPSPDSAEFHSDIKRLSDKLPGAKLALQEVCLTAFRISDQIRSKDIQGLI